MTTPLQFSLPSIPDLGDASLAMDLQHVLDSITQPPGALGQLGALAVQLGLILGTDNPRLDFPHLMLFAGDHAIDWVLLCGSTSVSLRLQRAEGRVVAVLGDERGRVLAIDVGHGQRLVDLRV